MIVYNYQISGNSAGHHEGQGSGQDGCWIWGADSRSAYSAQRIPTEAVGHEGRHVGLAYPQAERRESFPGGSVLVFAQLGNPDPCSGAPFRIFQGGWLNALSLLSLIQEREDWGWET